MINKIVRFIGAIVLAWLFGCIVDIYHLFCFEAMAHYFSNLSLSNLFRWELLSAVLLPIVWAIIWLIGLGIVSLAKQSKLMKTIVLIVFVYSIIADFRIVFIIPIEPIVYDIGHGFWYFFGAILSFIGMLICYGICSVSLFVHEE